jgi:hypothetical protein
MKNETIFTAGNQQATALYKSLAGLVGEDVKRYPFWFVTPYDWGPIVTSKLETFRPGRNCTLLMVYKTGRNKYTYLAFYSKDSKKRTKPKTLKGYPRYAMECYRDGSSILHEVRRKRFI